MSACIDIERTGSPHDVTDKDPGDAGDEGPDADGDGTLGGCLVESDCAAPGACQRVSCQDGVCVTASDDAQNGAACTPVEELCSAGACAFGTCVPIYAKVCDPSEDPCKVSACNPATGVCEAIGKPAGTPCSTHSECMVDGECAVDGSCLERFDLDSCGCGVDADCDDDAACTDDRCVDQLCSHTQVLCDDLLSCTTDSCDDLIGCVHEPSDEACDDAVECTVDSCSVELGCTHPVSHAACVDGDPCTAETCDPAAGCQVSPVASCPATPPFIEPFGCAGSAFTVSVESGDVSWAVDAVPAPGALGSGCSLNFNHDGGGYGSSPLPSVSTATSPAVEGGVGARCL